MLFRSVSESRYLIPEGPPVPIPNTEVKLRRAEDTLPATARDNRSAPTLGHPLSTRKVPVLVLSEYEVRLRDENEDSASDCACPRQGIPPRRGCSSVGRAPALQAGGHGFESHHLHQSGHRRRSHGLVAQLVRAPA